MGQYRDAAYPTRAARERKVRHGGWHYGEPAAWIQRWRPR
jgi:hypothetical protein